MHISAIRPEARLPVTRSASGVNVLTPCLDPTLSKAPPAKGWIQGQFHGKPLDLEFDRRQSTLAGRFGQNDVSLATDHDQGTITGHLGQREVDVRFAWSSERIGYQGDIDGRPVNLRLDWQKGRLEGISGGNATDLRFDIAAGRIKGQAGHGQVDLRFDKQTGRLEGSLGKGNLDMTLTNLDLHDFLQNFFVFS